MRKSAIALLGVGVVVALALILWKSRGHHAAPAKSPTGKGSATVMTSHAPAADAQPARVLVTVRDDKGPLAGATVRLAHEGDVTMLQTGADGIARADNLEAGDWDVSASAEGHAPGAAKTKELHAGETTNLDITLAAGGRTLTGIVTDATGGPIGGARIDAAILDGSVRPSDAVASTTTAADGKYKLTVAEGQLLVAASEASYAPQSRYVEVGASGATADFQLVPGGVIEGIVRDERSREPISGATVTAERDSPAMFGERSQHRATSGKDGRFRIAGLRPGAYSLTAKAQSVTSRAPTLVGIGVAEQVTDVEILVGRAATIRGTVVDENGAPAADVEVTAFGDDQSEQAKSDAKGAFAFEGIGVGRFMLMGRNDQFLPAGATKIDVADKDLDNVKVNVQHGLAIKGHVEPRQVCDLEVAHNQGGMGEVRMRFAPISTGADGEFSISPTQAGPVDLEARCASGDQGTQHVDVHAGMAPVVIAVKPGGSVAGRVVDGKGQPVGGVTVMASPIRDTETTTIVNGMMVGGIRAVTNSKGEFELRGLAAGSLRVRVLDRGRPLPLKSDEKLTLTANEKKTGVTLTVDRADGVIRGVVTGPDGKPLADAWVSLHQGIEDLIGPDMAKGESRMVSVEMTDDDNGEGGGFAPVLTDANGKFEIANLPRVSWTVLAEAQAGKLRGRQVKVVPDATVNIQALGITELKGTVKPPPGVFTVELDGPTRAQRSFSAADGSFSFGRVDPGDYRVSVTSGGGNGAGTVTVKPGQPASIDIPLAANATVIGKVVDASGKPLGGLPIAVIADTNDGQMRVELSGPPPTTNPDGTFRVEAKAGPSVVLVMVPPRPTSKRGLVLEAGKTTDAGVITVEAAAPK